MPATADESDQKLTPSAASLSHSSAAVTIKPDRSAGKHQHQARQESAPARRRSSAAGSTSSAACGPDEDRLDVAVDHALAFDDALGDVARDLVGDRLDLERFGKHDAAEPRVPEETVGATVAPHGDVAHRVDPQSRLRPRRDREVEAGVVRARRRRSAQARRRAARAASSAPRAARRRRPRGRRRRSSPRGSHRRAANCRWQLLLFGWIGHGRFSAQSWLSNGYHSRTAIARTPSAQTSTPRRTAAGPPACRDRRCHRRNSARRHRRSTP